MPSVFCGSFISLFHSSFAYIFVFVLCVYFSVYLYIKRPFAVLQAVGQDGLMDGRNFRPGQDRCMTSD